jgi:hypothetical protein
VSGWTNAPVAIGLAFIATLCLGVPAWEPTKEWWREGHRRKGPKTLWALAIIGALGLTLFAWQSPKAPELTSLGWTILFVAVAISIASLFVLFVANYPVVRDTQLPGADGEASPSRNVRRAITRSPFGQATIDQISALIGRGHSLEYPTSHYHLTTILDSSAVELWAQDYAVWEDAAISFLHRIGRNATADVFKRIKSPRSIYATSSMSLVVDERQLNRLRGQRELLEKIQEEMRG